MEENNKPKFTEEELKVIREFTDSGILAATRNRFGLPELTGEQLQKIKIQEGLNQMKMPEHVMCRCQIPDPDLFNGLPIIHEGKQVGNIDKVMMENNRILGRLNLSLDDENAIKFSTDISISKNPTGEGYCLKETYTNCAYKEPSKSLKEWIETTEKFKKELFELSKLKKSDIFKEPEKAPFWLADEFIITNVVVSKKLSTNQFYIYPSDTLDKIYTYGTFIPGFNYNSLEFSEKHKEIILVISKEDADSQEELHNND